MKLPSERALALALLPIKAIAKMDNTVVWVCVIVDLNSDWTLHTGPHQYEDDHEGFWGHHMIDSDSDLTVVAHDMIEEVLDDLYIHSVKLD